MSKSILTGRKRWLLAAGAAAVLVGGGIATTAAVAGEPSDDPSADQAAETDDGKEDDGDDLGEDGEPVAAPEVTLAEATEAAAGQVDGGIIDSAELNGPADTVTWEIELMTSDGTEHEVRIDATSGDVLDHQTEAGDSEDESDWAELEALDGATEVAPTDAADAALAEAGDGTVTEIERDGTADAPLWEVKVITADGVEHEVDVNAVDGSVTANDTDDEADDQDDADDEDGTDDDGQDDGSDNEDDGQQN